MNLDVERKRDEGLTNNWLNYEWAVGALSLCLQSILTNEQWLVEVSIIMNWLPTVEDKTQIAQLRGQWMWEQRVFVNKTLGNQWQITWFSIRTWAIFVSCQKEAMERLIHTWRLKYFAAMNLQDAEETIH